MILADKIIQLRKKNNWSQEEFASMMNVSRQAVSKWEQAQSVPDLDKILLMANIFGVSTDYLLKDEIETEEPGGTADSDYAVRRVSLEEANEFLKAKEKVSPWIAFGVMLCIFSPLPLIWMSTSSAQGTISLSPEISSTLGLTLLLLLVATAVGIFLLSGFQTNKFDYLEKEVFEVEYGVTSMVKQRQERLRPAYARNNIIGVILCILAVIPLIASSLLQSTFQINAVVIVLFIVAIAVFLFVSVGVQWGAFQQLLQEGDYSRKNKQHSDFVGAIAGVYWMLATALYLFLSFTNNSWDRTWIVWPVAGVLFGAIMIVVNAFAEGRNKH